LEERFGIEIVHPGVWKQSLHSYASTELSQNLTILLALLDGPTSKEESGPAECDDSNTVALMKKANIRCLTPQELVPLYIQTMLKSGFLPRSPSVSSGLTIDNDQFQGVNDLRNDMLSQTRLYFGPSFVASQLKIVCICESNMNATSIASQLAEVLQSLGPISKFYFIDTSELESKSQATSVWGAFKKLSKKVTRNTQDEKLTKLKQLLGEIGHVDALFGISHGAKLVEFLDRASVENRIPRSWNFSILFPDEGKYSFSINSPVRMSLPNLAILDVKNRSRRTNSLINSYKIDKQEILEYKGKQSLQTDSEFYRRMAEKVIRIAFCERV
jgi:hypothetical protein